VAEPAMADALASIRKELRRRRTHLAPAVHSPLNSTSATPFASCGPWQQPTRVQYAGLLHSPYSTDAEWLARGRGAARMDGTARNRLRHSRNTESRWRCQPPGTRGISAAMRSIREV
jgi:hypothetical protein